MNEIYITHATAKIEGKKKGPGTMEDGSLMKYLGVIRKPDMSKLEDREKLVISVTKMASLHLSKKIEWFSDKKEQRNDIYSEMITYAYLLYLAIFWWKFQKIWSLFWLTSMKQHAMQDGSQQRVHIFVYWYLPFEWLPKIEIN